MDLQHLRASDGTGEAILAHVQSVRNPGSTVLDLDNVDNWNSKVIVVTGTPAANGYIATAGMKVMWGHITAGDLIIDGFAPGYADNGNTTSEVAIVKMTTNWADALVDILSIAHQNDGKLKTTSLDHFFKPSEMIINFVASGGIVALSSGLTGTFSDIVYYVNGLRYTKTGVANKVYTATKDTYVDIDTAGTVSYTEVTVNASAPALAANSIRIAKVVTNGSTITSVVQNQPDSNGIWIKPDKPDFSDLDTGWINPTMTNSYVVQNGRTVSYRRRGYNILLRGQIGKATLDGNAMFTLPAGFRPVSGMAHIFTVPGVSTNIGKIQVADDGIVLLGGVPAGGAYVGLDAISFTVN